MSTRYNNGSHYENHQRAAELHDGSAHAHRSAAEQRGKQDHLTGQEQSRQALEQAGVETAFVTLQEGSESTLAQLVETAMMGLVRRCQEARRHHRCERQ